MKEPEGHWIQPLVHSELMGVKLCHKDSYMPMRVTVVTFIGQFTDPPWQRWWKKCRCGGGVITNIVDMCGWIWKYSHQCPEKIFQCFMSNEKIGSFLYWHICRTVRYFLVRWLSDHKASVRLMPFKGSRSSCVHVDYRGISIAWCMHHTLPPKVVVTQGDCRPGKLWAVRQAM